MKALYNELLFSRGYKAASLLAYLVYMADEDGKVVTSIAELTQVTGLSTQNIRTILNNIQLTNKTSETNKQIGVQSTNQNTIVTIKDTESYEVRKKDNQQTKTRATNKQKNQNQQTKESPPLSPLNVSPHTPLLNPPYNPPKESTIHYSASEKFLVWLEENCPYIRSHYKMMTDGELEKLKKQFGTEAIIEVCMDIENRKDLRKNYTNLYRTSLNWLKRRNENNRTTHTTTTEQRVSEAADLVNRLMREDGGQVWQP